MADYKKQQQQKIKEATEQLEAGIKDFFSSGNFQEYLNVMSRFHTYSYSNSIMIAMQKPDATLLAGYSGWQKKFERHVKPGEHGIKIFAPAPVKVQIEREKKDPDTDLPELDENGDPVMETVEIKTPKFKVVTVFDVSQTDGKPLPDLGIDELTGNVENFDQFFDALTRTSTVPISFEEMDGDTNGYFSLSEKRIAIREGMSEAQTIKTAIHELAHSRLHDFDRTASIDVEKRKDRNTKEVEAESIAYVVCQHFDIDTSDYSFGYVATWSANRELPELKASLQTIRDAAASLINDIEQNYSDLQREHKQNHQIEKTVISEPTISAPVQPLSPEKNEWKCYIIPDIMTWTNAGVGMERSEIEYFDSFDDAVTRFRELRTESYNSEEIVDETSDKPYARLTFGIQRDDPTSAVDLLHVRAGRNVLVEDFTRMDAIKENPNAMVILSTLGSQIGFDDVLVNRNMTPEEVRQFTFEHFKFKLEQSGVPQIESYLSGFDKLYDEGQLDSLKPSANQQRISEFQNFSDWENPYFTVKDTTERLATDLAVFMTSYDPYTDADKNGAEKYAEIHDNLANGNTSYLKEWLSSIVMEKDEFSEQAAVLSERLETLTPTPEQSAENDRSSIIMQLATDLDQFAQEHDAYEYADVIENRMDAINQNIIDISAGNTNGIVKWLQTVIEESDIPTDTETAKSLMQRLSEFTTDTPTIQAQSRLSFYVAECSEFPGLGELHENLSLEEAIHIYHEIPSDRMNGVKGIGFNLEDGSIYDGQMALMSGGVVHADVINAIDHYRNNPEIQQAMNTLKTLFSVPEFEPEQEPKEAVFQTGNHYLHIQSATDGSWDYTYYNQFMEVIDGGQIGDENMRFSQARNEILELLDIPASSLSPISLEKYEEMLDSHENDLHCPVYHKDLKQARADGEMEQWRISHHATETCAEQFRSQYERAYENRQVPQFLQQMIDRYGLERCKIVVASTIQLSPRDGRYSQDMKDAAAKVVIPGASTESMYDRRRDYCLNCHPVTVNIAMRDLLAIERQQEQAKMKSQKKEKQVEKGSGKRSSIRKKLERNKAIIAAGSDKSQSTKRDNPQL